MGEDKIKVKVIDKKTGEVKDFYKEFIEHLKMKKDFWLRDCIVEGDINIFDIYMKIKEKIKDKNRIRELITKREDNKGTIMEINIDIFIHIDNVEFKGNFISYNNNISRNIETIKTIFKNSIVFGNSIFEKDIVFMESTFEGLSIFGNLTFKGKVDFSKAIFKKKAEFSGLIFEKETFFNNTKFNNIVFEKTIFKSITKFDDIEFELLIFSECIFEYISHFKNKQSDRGFAVFYKCSFGHKEVIIENFLLSRTSFLKTDVRDVLILCDTENNKILSHEILNFKECILIKEVDEELDKIISGECNNYDNLMLKLQKLFEIEKEKPYDLTIIFITKVLPKLRLSLKRIIKKRIIDVIILKREINSKKLKLIVSINIPITFRMLFIYLYLKIYKSLEKLDERYRYIYKIIAKDLNYKSVLAEYRNLRLSIENNRTYVEASELFKKEMELIKEKSGIFEKIIIWFYGKISNYGESIFMPFFWTIYVIFVTPFIVLDLNYMLGNFPQDYTYTNCLFDTLRAFFQLGIKDNDSLMYNYEWLIRIISLILLGNIFIAIKRRLERK